MIGRFLGGQLLEKSIRGDAGEFLQSQNQPGPHLMLPFAQSYVRPFPHHLRHEDAKREQRLNVRLGCLQDGLIDFNLQARRLPRDRSSHTFPFIVGERGPVYCGRNEGDFWRSAGAVWLGSTRLSIQSLGRTISKTKLLWKSERCGVKYL